MEKNRILTLQFNDGSNIVFSFPEDSGNAMAKKLKLAAILSGNQLMIEADGDLLVFPISNIKYLKLSAVDFSEFEKVELPKTIIRNATILK
jgi:hypothetical protein